MKKMVALILCALMFSSCAWLKSSANTAKQVVIDCTVPALKDAAENLLPLVLAVLTGNNGNWRDILGDLGKDAGKEALACALKAATNALAQPGQGVIISVNDGLTKGQQYIREQGFSYVAQ